MVSLLEESTAVAANKQLQDMLSNAITDPDKFRNLSITVKVSHVGKNINKVSLARIGHSLISKKKKDQAGDDIKCILANISQNKKVVISSRFMLRL